MKIKYQFVTGEVTEVEISEEIGAVIIDLDRQEYNNDHKETRRHESLYKTEEYGDYYAADDDTEGEVIAREDAVEQNEQFRKLHHAIKKLTPDQQDLVDKVILGGMTITAYAKQIGISQPAATQRRQTIMKKLKKFF